MFKRTNPSLGKTSSRLVKALDTSPQAALASAVRRSEHTPKTHTQKKYFSLTLIPSHSTGQARSLRIPYGVLYGLAVAVVAVTVLTLSAYTIAARYGASLAQVTEAYQELHEQSLSRQSRSMEDQELLESQLTDEKLRHQAETFLQKRDYQDSLESLQEQVDDLEHQLRELDETRLEIMDQLGASAFIPPVQALLNEMADSQSALLAETADIGIRSGERALSDKTSTRGAGGYFSLLSKKTSEEDLRDYFTLLSAKAQLQLACFADLNSFAGRINTYRKNYPTILPVYGITSSGFGFRGNPMGGGGGEHHDGIDFRCPVGTTIRAAGGGIVKEAGWDDGGYGNAVIIDHGQGLQTMYAHNSELVVEAGQRVERGDVIAKSGSTGRSTGPHLHYEVRVNGSPVDPSSYFLE